MVLSGVYSVLNMSKTEPVQSAFPRSSMTTYNSSNNSIIALLKHRPSPPYLSLNPTVSGVQSACPLSGLFLLSFAVCSMNYCLGMAGLFDEDRQLLVRPIK